MPIWLCTYKGTAKLEDGSWSAYGPERGWNADYARTFAEGPSGELYATSFNGKVLHWSGESTIARDISERKRSEDALKKSEASLRAFIDAIPEPSLLMDGQGTILVANDAMARSLGKPLRELIGVHAFDQLPPELAIERRRRVAQVIESRRLLRFEDANGGRHFINFVSPVADADGNVSRVAVFAIDITEGKRAETELRASEERLRACIEHTPNVAVQWYDARGRVLFWNRASGAVFGWKAEEAIGTLAGGIAHDFNNVLSAIAGNTRLAGSDLPADHPAQVSLAEIVKATARASDLVRQILAFSRHHEAERKVIHLRPVIEEALNLLRAAMPAMIEIRADLDDDLPPVSGEGTGLGLASVHGIVMSHGGAISVRSAPGEGTTFDLYFPACGVEAPVAAPPPPPAESVRGRGEHILYVDDEEPLVFLASRMLKRMGYRVTGFTRPLEALEAYRAQSTSFDVVIADVAMPGMSGPDLARELLK